jgi:hypothetical protein
VQFLIFIIFGDNPPVTMRLCARLTCGKFAPLPWTGSTGRTTDGKYLFNAECFPHRDIMRETRLQEWSFLTAWRVLSQAKFGLFVLALLRMPYPLQEDGIPSSEECVLYYLLRHRETR